MTYSALWADKAQRVIEVLRVVDPVMAQELSQAADLIATNPFALGSRARGTFDAGKQYPCRVRDGIVFHLNFHLDPRRGLVIITDVAVAGPNPP